MESAPIPVARRRDLRYTAPTMPTVPPIVMKTIAALAAAGVALACLVTLSVVAGLPDIDSLRDVRMQVPLRVYSHDKRSLIAEYGEKRRIPLAIEEAPRQLIDAFIAAEDERFYEHAGVDMKSLMRAAVSLFVARGEIRQGGSTITMQVARNFFLSREKTYIRKLNEIFLALKIEKELDKEEILELYINKIYLGQRAYGIGAAAQIYYGAQINELTLPQYAMIAGLPKAPSAVNPVSNPRAALKRRSYVLRRMLQTDQITREEFELADEAPLTASLHSAAGVTLEAPYIAEMVRLRLTEEYGDEAYTAGYIVTTTVREKHQRAANHALKKALLEYDGRHGYRGPEHRYELPPEAGEEEWRQLLQPYSAIGPLYPALITAVGEQTASAYLAGIGGIDIAWPGLQWARRYIDENRLGPAPKTAADILRRGDVVRIAENRKGDWVLSQLPEVEGAFVAAVPDNGAVLALSGGFDFYRSKFNRVTQAKRQPGSSFKPFVYSAAIANGFSTASMINDAPVVFNDPSIGREWRPQNYSGRSFGPTSLREALRKSRNLVSIRLLDRLGVRRTINHIEKFGFERDELPDNLSLALGSGAVTPWRLAEAYTTLANGGYRIALYFIEKITTHEGALVYEARPRLICRDCPEAEVVAGGDEAAAGEIAPTTLIPVATLMESAPAAAADTTTEATEIVPIIAAPKSAATAPKSAPTFMDNAAAALENAPTVAPGTAVESVPDITLEIIPEPVPGAASGITPVFTRRPAPAMDTASEEQQEADAPQETDLEPAYPPQVPLPPPPPLYAERSVEAENVWIMHSLLKDVIRAGTGVKAYHELKRRDLAGKTGTTNEQHDAWFAGFNTKVVAVTWVGFDQSRPLGNSEVGGKAALPMWIEYMRAALKGTSISVMERPAGLVNIRIDPKAGCRTRANDAGTVFEVFQPAHLENLPQCETVAIPFIEQEHDTAAGPLF